MKQNSPVAAEAALRDRAGAAPSLEPNRPRKRATILDGRVFCTKCGEASASLDDQEEIGRVFGFRRMNPDAVDLVRQPQCRPCRALASKASAAKKRAATKSEKSGTEARTGKPTGRDTDGRHVADVTTRNASPSLVADGYHDVVLEALELFARRK